MPKSLFEKLVDWLTVAEPEPFVMLESHAEIEAWLDTYCDINGKIEISPEGLVNVIGDVGFHKPGEPSNRRKQQKIRKLPVKFGEVSGSFDIEGIPVVSLQGCPNMVGGDFLCGKNKHLYSLMYAPMFVTGSFCCRHNTQLQDLTGGPVTVGSYYNCFGCKSLTSTKGVALQIGHVFGGDLHLVGCTGLTKMTGGLDISGSLKLSHCAALQTINTQLPIKCSELHIHDCPNLEISVQHPLRQLTICGSHKQPSAESFKALLEHVEYIVWSNQDGSEHPTDSSNQPLWISLLETYLKTKDLLMVIENFEELYEQPFLEKTVTIQNAPEVPML